MSRVNDIITELIGEYSGNGIDSRTLTIQVPILKFLGGDHVATLYFCQIMFWWSVMKKKGKDWFYKTDQSFAEELYISERTLQRIRTKFVHMGYIQTKIKKLPNGETALHYSLTDKLKQELADFFVAQNNIVDNEQRSFVGNHQNGNPGSPNCRVRVRQSGESSYIQKMSFTEDDKIKKEEPVFSLDSPFKDFESEAPSGVDLATPEEQVKTSSASQGNREGDINIDNHGINDNNTISGIQKRSGNGSVGAGAAAADTAAAVAWIAALNDKTGSIYPPAAGFIKAYDKAKKQNSLSDTQMLSIIDNAIASGLAGTWLSPNHLLRHALDFAFAAPRQNKKQPTSSGKIATNDLDCLKDWCYLEDPKENPNARKINKEEGFRTGAIVDGQTVWTPNGSKTSIYS